MYSIAYSGPRKWSLEANNASLYNVTLNIIMCIMALNDILCIPFTYREGQDGGGGGIWEIDLGPKVDGHQIWIVYQMT